ncbi:unnamed protein product [Durusdinium trenchii]|uniref:EF-hand domain-containing protein n=2 Tax=Durusdinium trenchii TaxID=1381693 RepID=A0ABP0LNV8_9DINO
MAFDLEAHRIPRPGPGLDSRVLLAEAREGDEWTPISHACSGESMQRKQLFHDQHHQATHYSALLRDETQSRISRKHLRSSVGHFPQGGIFIRKNVVGWVVFINMLMIGLETDGFDWPFWRLTEVLFALFYCYEFVLRLYWIGPDIFAICAETGRGDVSSLEETIIYVIDGALVILGVANLVMIFFFQSNMSSWMLYTRIARGLRVFYLFESLHRFATALSEMFATLSWIFGVLTFIVYLVAVLLTNYTKQELDLAGEEAEYFGSIVSTMFSLFQVTTMDSWPDIAAPLVHHSLWWRMFFVIFIAFSAWTMISLVTAVVSDNVIQATQDRKEKQKEAQERRRKEFVDFLKVCFVNADADGNQVLDHEEFATLIKDEQVVAKMEDLGVTLPLQELEKAFEMLDVDEDGELSIDEFTAGLSQLQESLNTKHVVSLDYALQRISAQLTKRLDSLETTVGNRSDAIVASVDKLTMSLQDFTQTLNQFAKDASASSGKRWLPSLGAPPRTSQSSSG